MPDANVALDAIRDEALALSADDLTSPRLPLEIFIAEGEAMIAFIDEDAPTRERLFATRFKAPALERLRTLLLALSLVQQRWRALRLNLRDQRLIELLAQAEALRDDTLMAADYNTDDDRVATARLDAIREGDGVADLLDDLRDLDLFLEDHADAFAEDELFDLPATRARITALLADLAPLLAADDHGADRLSARTLRDRVFTLADRQLQLLRQSARYAFAKDPDRAERFRSRYIRARGRRYRARLAAQAASTPPPPPRT